MATSKSTGASRLGRDSRSKRLGVKLFSGQKTKAGSIIIRQRGTKYFPGLNVKRGNDDTLYAVKEGLVQFISKQKQRFDGKIKTVKIVNVIQQ